MISWPKKDQWVAVSTTTSPVTHIEDVAVKRQVKKSVGWCPLLEIGRDRSKAPKNIAITKLPSIVWVEFNFVFKFLIIDNLNILYIITYI